MDAADARHDSAYTGPYGERRRTESGPVDRLAEPKDFGYPNGPIEADGHDEVSLVMLETLRSLQETLRHRASTTAAQRAALDWAVKKLEGK